MKRSNQLKKEVKNGSLFYTGREGVTMSDKIFLENQFRKRKIPEGSREYSHFEECKKIIQGQSKLSPRVYDEFIKIAVDYCKV